MYQPDQIDPETIKTNVDAPIRENLEGLIQIAKFKALREKAYVMINHAVDPDSGNDSIQVKSARPEDFESLTIQCPREADETFQASKNMPRPIPSILVTPEGQVVVSKPGLCNSCEHRLRKSVFGCGSARFAPINRDG